MQHKLFKSLFIFIIMISIVSATVTISTDKFNYNCDFTGCEIVNINIQKTGESLNEQVYLRIDFEDDNGYMTQVNNFIKKGNKNRYELTTPFDLPNGNKYYDMDFNALGKGKFNISVVGANTGFVYYVLDPWWNSTYEKRVKIDIITENGLLYDYNPSLNLTSNIVDYELINDDGSDLRFTWLNDTSSLEQEIYYFIEDYNENLNSTIIWLNAPKINGTYYVYYGNLTEVTTNSDGFNTFPFWDDFLGTSINSTYWYQQEASTNGEIVVANSLLEIRGGTASNYWEVWSTRDAYKFDPANYSFDVFGYSNANTDGFAITISDRIDGGGTTGSNPDDYILTRGASFNMVFKTESGGSTSTTPTLFNYNDFQVLTFEEQSSSYCVLKNNYTIDTSASTCPVDDLKIVLSASNFANDNHNLTIDWVRVRKFTNDTISLSFYPEENSHVTILNPVNESTIFGRVVTLNFSTRRVNENHSIFLDGVFNKSVNVTGSGEIETYEEDFTFSSSGEHNITVTITSEPTLNETIYFTLTSLLFDSFNFNSSTYELNYQNISSGILHTSDVEISSAILVHNNTNYTMDIINFNSTLTNVSSRFLTPFAESGSNENISFNIYIYLNDSSMNISDQKNQTVLIAYYIENITSPDFGSSGALIRQNLTVTDLANIAIITLFANGSEIGSNQGSYINGTTYENWYVTFNLPSVSVLTVVNISNYIKIQYGGQTVIRYFEPEEQISVVPIEVGYCSGSLTKMILNYSAWDEYNNTNQITTNNYWETKLLVKSTDGTEVTSFGFYNTTALHQICMPENASYEINASTWITNNASNYVKRSHFILNKGFDNATETEQVRIYLLNVSLSSTIDFFVKDVFGESKENRIIKFFKYFPEINDYEELFNLITDQEGHAVGFLKAYDAWYKIVVIDENGVITKTIPSTQISQSEYTIIEGAISQSSKLLGVNAVPYWDSVTKIFSLTINSEVQRDFKLVLTEYQIWSNVTYCVSEDTGSTLVLYCDLSNSTVEEFNWDLSYLTDGVEDSNFYISIKSGVIKLPETPPYGIIGLILTAFLVITMASIFSDSPKKSMVSAMLALTVCRLISLAVFGYEILLGLWSIVIVILYLLRGEKG